MDCIQIQTEALILYNTSISKFSPALLEWYKSNRRDLPWRITPTPYAVWVSEIMLQQTQVQTVIPYYKRWMERLPHLMAVAEADLELILKLWEGLGYYSRARNFHQAARRVKAELGGIIPADFKVFMTLPGVGQYTAAAVMSMAFGQPIPALDGNIKRISSRYLGIRRLTSRNLKRIDTFLARAINPRTSGDFNQALMDLGSAICRPKQALCIKCPLAYGCYAKAKGEPHAYPIKSPKKPIPHRQMAAGMIWKKGEFLISKRTETGLLGGLWEIPGVEIGKNQNDQENLCAELGKNWGLDIDPGEWIGSVNHAYTHFRLTVNLYQCTIKNGSGISSNRPYRWIKQSNISSLPFSKVNHKLFELFWRKEPYV